MTDLATLAIKVTTSGAGKSARDLNNVERAAKRTETATEQLNKCFGRLQALLALSGIGGGISHLLALADKMQSLRNQVQFVTSSMTEMNQVQKELFEIAQRTRGSLEATTTLYTRSARALKDYGYAQKDILQFTETMNKAMAVGGVSAEAQASALFQLSQALGSGQLQGDEFKTIAESAPIILDVLAEYMGKSRAEVKKLAGEGQLTSKLIFEAFNGSTEKINQKFEQMPLSFGGAMQQMENAFMKFADEQNRTLGITENLAAGISFLAQNFEYLAGVLLAIAAGNGAKFISTLVLARVETHRQAQASLIAAKATQTQAAAELAAAQAKMNLLNSEMQLARTKKARAAIEAKMAQQAQVITGLINAEAVAMNNLATASQRASIASNAAAGAKNLLSGALGLIGGPAGAATIAAGALFYFTQKAQEAKEAALDTESANNRLKESYDGLSESALTLKIIEQTQAMENYSEQISKVRAEISQIQTSAWQFGLELSESSKQDLEKLNAELERIRENKNIDLSVLSNQLTALGGVFLSNGKSIDDFRTKMKNLGIDANTADGVIASLSNTIKQQKEAAQGGVKANLELDEAFKKLKERSLTVAQNLEVAKLKQQGQAESAFVLAGLYELLGEKGAEYNQVLIDIANGTITAANAADKSIDLSIETLNKLIEGRQVLQGMFKDQAQTESINQSLRGSRGGGENARDSWLSFYDEIRKHSRSSLEEIDAEQQRMLQRLEEHMKKGVVSHEEYESAKLAISQRFANERAKLAEQFAPELQYARELKEHLQDIQRLNAEGRLTHDQAKKATENATWDAGNKQAQLAGQNAVSEYDRWKAEFDPTQAIQNQQTSKLAELQSLYDQELIQYQDFVNAKAQIDNKATQDTQNLFMSSISGFGGAIDTMLGVMRNAGQEQSDIYKTMFAMSKAFAIADSIMKIQQGIANAAAQPFPANIAAMATVASETASIISTIQSVSLSGMAHSGIDSIPKEGTWLLDRGERVVDSRTNQDLKAFLANQGNRNQASGKSSVNVQIINNGNAVDAKVSQEETPDGTHITVELLKTMRGIAREESQNAITNNFARAGGQFRR
ncbi:tape measure protein [Glaesserella parasuis]|uniref:tape measure protein n=1 Tax=Glaesserella parasuis TaxID=738 RepID=UPI00243685BD|nr:tape measure protein [Glaesserella parasuis]MDG6318734.1 tape measure protein [Glaesserella parasuis]MDO9806481.1 tape measure protein [Glaesserella parasuis]MDP0333575.1 tape measure protein [Glaesserella parasuis]MDP0404565.1 tape measure protein [Glaesserella parasuis]MDP0452599.1 tape measure protein [Glaesserella parasuis]